jgi:hypothetical protein
VLWHLLLRVVRSPQVPVAAGLLPAVVELPVVVAAAAVVAVVAVVLLVPDRPERRRARSRWS